jgi:hypothetical protein
VERKHCIGPEAELLASKQQIMNIFACEDQGPMKEYIGNKIDYDMECKLMKITQPVFVQSLSDECQVSKDNRGATPGVPPGQVLTKGVVDVDPEQQYIFRRGVGKLIHLQKWSHPDVINSTRDLARFMGCRNKSHMKALVRETS